MDNNVSNITDGVLFRKLYARIFAQQVRAENRVSQLMMAPKGIDRAFDEYLVVLRRKVELDRRKLNKLGERVAVMEKNEEGNKRHRVNTPNSQTQPMQSQYFRNEQQREARRHGPSTNDVSTLLNSLAMEFGFSEDFVNPSATPPPPATSNTRSPKPNPARLTEIVDHRDVEISFDDTQTTRSPNRRMHTHPNAGVLQVEQDNSFNKKVSFNEEPRVIVTQDSWVLADRPNNKITWMSNFDDLERRRYHGDDNDEVISPHDNTRQEKRQLIYNSYPQEMFRETFDLRKTYGYTPRRKVHQSQVDRPSENLFQINSRGDESRIDHVKTAQFKSKPGMEANSGSQPDDMSLLLDKMFEAINHTDSATHKTNEVALAKKATSVPRDPPGNPFEENVEDFDRLMAEKMFKTKTQYCTKFNEWLEFRRQEESRKQHMRDVDEELYERITKVDPHFFKDDALVSMRRKSWLDKEQFQYMENESPKPRRLSAIFQRMRRKSSTSTPTAVVVIKGNKKEFHVKPKVRRRMSLRPLPDTPSQCFGPILQNINEI